MDSGRGLTTTITDNITANGTAGSLYGDFGAINGFTNYVELGLLLMFLFVWLTSLIWFFTRWNNVSLMQPYGANLLYVPQNLESVTVVQKEEESVIYCR